MATKKELLRRADRYAQRHGLVLADQLGFGIHGIVFVAESQTESGRSATIGLTCRRSCPHWSDTVSIWLTYRPATLRFATDPVLVPFFAWCAGVDMTIVERALELVANDSIIGLGSGRAARAFVLGLGERLRAGDLRVRGVPTSEETAALARDVGVPLVSLAEAGTLDMTVDGADEVDLNLDLIKGYGRALVREKIVAESSRRYVILVGKEKVVPRLGTRGKLPVEVVPFALPLCEARLRQLGCQPALWAEGSRILSTDNGNYILDCLVGPIDDPARLESDIRAIPGVVGSGLFLGMADLVLIGEGEGYRLTEERRRTR